MMLMLIISVTITSISAISYGLLLDAHHESEKRRSENLVNSISMTVNRKIDSLSDMLIKIAESREFEVYTSSFVSRHLLGYLDKFEDSFDSISIVDVKGKEQLRMKKGENLGVNFQDKQSFSQLPAFVAATKHFNKVTLGSVQKNEAGENVIPVVLSVRNYFDEFTGSIVAFISVRNLFSTIDYSNAVQGDLIVYSPGDNVPVYYKGHIEEHDFLSSVNHINMKSTFYRTVIAGVDGYLTEKNISGSDWRVSNLYYHSDFKKPLNYYLGYIALCGCLFVIAAIWLSLCLAKRISSPLKELTLAINQYSETHTPLHVNTNSDDEISILTQSFNTMTENLNSTEKKLLREVSQRKKNQTELEIAVLNEQQANSAKSRFIKNISHELRTPLHSVLSYASIGNKRINKNQMEDLDTCFSNISESGNRLLALVDNLIDISNLEKKNIKLHKTNENIKSILDSILRQMQVQFEFNQLHCTIEVHVDDTSLFCDKKRIVQVFEGLIENAIKYSPQNSTISIIVETISADKLSDHVEQLLVRVSDEGIGIPPEELESIFTIFTQSSLTESQAGGRGLGLAISKQIIQLHGGNIWAENNAGKGACFCVALPHLNTLPIE